MNLCLRYEIIWLAFRWVLTFYKINVFWFGPIDNQNNARCIVGNNGSIFEYISKTRSGHNFIKVVMTLFIINEFEFFFQLFLGYKSVFGRRDYSYNK